MEYTGKFKKGMPNGMWRLITSKEDIYEGSFLEGKKHGKSKYFFSSVAIYTVKFLND